MPDLYHQNFSSVQSGAQPLPSTIASAATITPTTALTIVTGVVQIATITPPVSGFHILYLMFPDAMGVFATTGNIAVAADPGANIPLAMVYNPLNKKYYPGAIS